MPVSKSPTRRPQRKPSKDILLDEARVPPQDKDLERIVLGAILQEREAYARVNELLTPETFYDSSHQQIYQAMVNLAIGNHAIDLYTIKEELTRMQKLEEVGDIAYLVDLTSGVISSRHIEDHAQILANKALSRKLIEYSTDMLRDAYEEAEEVSELLQRAEGRLFEISQKKDRKDFRDIKILVNEAMKEVQTAANQAEGISGITSGFPDIDTMTSGWQKSDLIIIAARPAMGKTAFVVSMLCNMALDHQIPVALFNLEMSDVQLSKRLLSNVCEIDGQGIKSGKLNEQEWERLSAQIPRIETAPIYINDTPSLSVFELRSSARRLVREHGVKMIIIDYLQLMNASGMGFGNREQEVSMISRSLKMLAKELNIPIVALSQLNRGVENRQGDANSKRPQLSDLRESGAIEQDADIVCFIHRPDYYRIYQDPATGEDLRGLAEFIIAKHRNGPVGDVRLKFKGDFAKFTTHQSVGKDLAGGSRVKQRAFAPSSASSSATELPQVDFNNPVGSPFGGDKPPF